MNFRVLGPLEAGDEGAPLALGPRKQRALLARLLLDTGRTVAVERLIDDLWGDDVPETAVKMVQIYVSGLRKAVTPDRLRTRPPGYCLDLGAADVLDLHEFERLAAAGRAALAGGTPAEAAERLRAALGLWRGPALAEFSAEPFARPEGDRLEALQLAAIEDRIDADLELGRAADVTAELQGLTARHPLRERLRAQLMLALYRVGRQGEALSAYHAFRATLDTELGIDPSPRLRALEHAILTQDRSLDAQPPPVPRPATAPNAPPGRSREAAAIHSAFETAAAGSRRMVLVTGEAGIGKTTLVEAALAGVGDALVIRGQCVEQRVAAEPYLPLLDGLARAALETPLVAEVLASRAPSWLAQLPWLAAQPPEERVHGATHERMLRELVEGLEALAAARPVVLVLDDLQWADRSTVDLLGALMRRRHPARLLVLATREGPDPLVAELSLRGTAQKIRLGPLDAAAAAAAWSLEPGAAERLTHRTGGNPLFIAHLAKHVEITGDLDGVPETLRAAMQSGLSALSPETLAALQAGAVAGQEFTATVVSAALDRTVTAISAPGIVEPRGTTEWPDGTSTAVFAFCHPLHRDVVEAMVPAARRAEWHRRIGERLEAAFGTDPATAHEIAVHYAAGRRPAPAVRFLRIAAARCIARRAYREAIEHLQRALEAADDLPDGPPRNRARVELLSELGQAHVAVDGWSSPIALDSLQRARSAAQALKDREPLMSVSLALGTLHEVRGETAAALEAVAGRDDQTESGAEGAELIACALFHQGAFARALEHAERGAEALTRAGDDGHYDTYPATLGDNAIVACHDWAALSLWFLGRPAEALRRARRALELADEPSRAYSNAAAHAQLAVLHACRGEPEEALHHAQATIDAARDRGYDYRVAMGRVLRGWALAATGRADGVEEIACGLQASRATGAHLEDPFYLGLLADAHLRIGSPQAGLAAVDEALQIAARERAHYYDAELHRLRGELLLPAPEAEAALRTALATAAEQHARTLELRAALALTRAFPGAGTRARLAAAHERLADADTADVRAAAALLGGADARPAGAERRRITVLAWEIDGLGDLAERLQPERLAALVTGCHAAARTAADREDAHIATEDEAGGLIYFGYPQACEDAPERAIRAGRALAHSLQEGAAGLPLKLCAGIDTGTAVVAPLGAAALALGATPRTAWRLAAAAPPGEVLVSERTRTLCADAFGFAAHGPGHVITGDRARSRMVGRARELELLVGRWQQAEHALGQAVLLSGEPGIGKTRLVRELARRLDAERSTVLSFQCSDARSASALHPVADHFRRALEARGGGLEALLAEAGVAVGESAPVVAALLGAADTTAEEPDALKRHTADIIVSYVLAHAERRPVLVVLEDLHWADPSTLELVGELVDSIAESRAFIVATARPGTRVDWPASAHVSQLSLGPCSREEAEILIAQVMPEPLPPDVARVVIERADGIPLLIEELARAAATGGQAAIPATLYDVVMDRLARLGPAARAVAESGALIGREFTRDLLATVAELPDAELDRGLSELAAAGLVRRRGRPPALRYSFRHALLQEGAREAVAQADRQRLHARIARALERGFPELLRTEPEMVARHLEAAGNAGRAVPYRFDAASLALRRSAAVEAADQLAQALTDLDALPDDDRRAELELDLRIAHGNALLSSRGYAALEVAETYARARALCAQTGDDTRLLPVLYGLWVNAFVRARHDQVLELGLELRELAERHDTGVLIVAERAVGWPLICMGRFEEARVHLDRIPALHDPTGSRPPRYLYGQDPSVAGLATGAWALWGCGEEREAHARAEQAIALARGLAHPLTLAYALGAGALLAGFCRDASLARERSVEAIAVTDEYSLPLWRGWSLYALAAAELLEGDGERATATLHAGLEVARGTGAALFEPFALTVLGEAQASVGRRDAALRALEAAAAAARRTGELFWQPQTRRAQDALVAARS